MALTIQGEYNATAPSYTTSGKQGKLQMDRSASLAVTTRPPWPETPVIAAGAGSTYGLLSGTVANAASIYVACDCSTFPVNYIDWCIKSDQQYTYQFYKANSNVLSGTITLTDGTAVDADDTFLLNGLTYTYKVGAGTPASRFIGLGADNAAAAANTLTAITGAYGVPGVSAVLTSAVTPEVITLSATTALTLSFGQGSSAANEVGWAETTLASLRATTAVSSNTAANSTTAGQIHQQTMNGWKWGYVRFTNTSGGAAATPLITTYRY